MDSDPTSIPPTNPASSALQSLQVVALFVFLAVVCGGALLLSAAESRQVIDGAIPWTAESWLRAVVQILCLNYEFPTPNPGEIKGYLLGIGTGLLLLSIAVTVLSRSKAGSMQVETGVGLGITGAAARRGSTSALAAAQILAGLYVLWSFASSRWSTAPDLSVGGSVILAIQFLWAFGVAHTLDAQSSRIACRIMVVALGVASGCAVWYYYGRNPVLPAKFPFGNPSFLAASLIPGVVLSIALLLNALPTRDHPNGLRTPAAWVIVAATGLLLSGLAMALANSRGPAVGLAFGLLALAFFTLRGRWRFLTFFAAVALAAVAFTYFSGTLDDASTTGRSASARFRLYAWSYAWRMFTDRPIVGHGQGGYGLHTDAFTVDDILADPLPFVGRVDHAHNEWLEVLADLGIIGGVLVLAILMLTFVACFRAMHRASPREGRWMLAGCTASLVGLVVSECFGVGLRVCETPTFFYSVLGIAWAGARQSAPSLVNIGSRSRLGRMSAAALAGGAGILTIALAQQDFFAARQAYRAAAQLRSDDPFPAAASAQASIHRLWPQRALVNRAQLCDVYLTLADRFQRRAVDRARRAEESVPQDPRLRQLAGVDFAEAEAYTTSAARELKELVSRSPSFLNIGLLEFRVNVLSAQAAAAREDTAASEAFIRNAGSALEREMRRQPFEPSLVVDYVRVAGGDLDPPSALQRLARPLRHHRLGEAYLSVLRYFAQDEVFMRGMEGEIGETIARTMSSDAEDRAAAANEWSPERLRLGAALFFLVDRTADAAQTLDAGAAAYESLAASAPLGAAAFFAELADMRFFAAPRSPLRALVAARRAIEIAPDSEDGRGLRDLVRQRMIYYHLAGDQAAEALEVLQATAPADAPEEAVRRELGVRYQRLAESILTRRRELLRRQDDEGQEIRAALGRWLDRAIELAPDEFPAYFLAADLALFQSDPAAAARQLEQALQRGLDPVAAQDLLDAASQNSIRHPAMDSLRERLSPPTDDERAKRGGEQPSPD